MNRRELDRLLGRLVALDGSHLHVKAGSRPRVRLKGELMQLREEPVVGAEDLEALLGEVMHGLSWEHFERRFDADFAYSVPNLGRFRASVLRQRGSVGIVLRYVRPGPLTIADLGLPDAVRRLAGEHSGLVLVSGPAASGRTATLAAIIDHINVTRECHIVTIEDPIEVLHADRRASITQREIGIDAGTVLGALRRARRQDPDVIVLGELRDVEAASALLEVGEEGRLVLSTFSAEDAVDTVSRFVDMFPVDQRQQARRRLSASLRGTISQRIVPAANVSARRAAVEIMVVTARIRQCIADPDQTGAIRAAVATDGDQGMQSLAQSLCGLVAAREIDVEVAMAAAPDPHELSRMLQASANSLQRPRP